jgi:hypothetical protein
VRRRAGEVIALVAAIDDDHIPVRPERIDCGDGRHVIPRRAVLTTVDADADPGAVLVAVIAFLAREVTLCAAFAARVSCYSPTIDALLVIRNVQRAL